ncbi:MAG: hypothetical protein HDS70_07955 [Bacteroidales bacterium]|nr:hypothetical protein [Bacteroidales bacterium]
MEQLKKVNSFQLYLFWKNFSIGILVMVAVVVICRMLPYYLAPVISLLGVAFLYTMLFNNKSNNEFSCMIGPYAIFVCLITYSFVSIVFNMLFAWKLMSIPKEFVFFTDPYIPALFMIPSSFVTMIFVYIFRNNLSICKECNLKFGGIHERGKFGRIINYESKFQLANLLLVFGVLSAIIWSYYLGFYKNINQNARDWYVFTWLVVITLVLDELYFAMRYYNLYLDLKENDELLTPEDLMNMTSKIYLRFYVVCGNNIYMNVHEIDPKTHLREIIDTPFMTKRSIAGITIDEVKNIIVRMTGVDNGELRFFFGRKGSASEKQSILRYFYFLDGKIEDYPSLKTPGEWLDFNQLKKIYSASPGLLSDMTVADTNRLATIIITEKLFNDKGFRKSKIKSYVPTFSLEEVRDSVLDFQDDKWIKISSFNSDRRFFRLRTWWRKLMRGSRKKATWM